MASTSAVPMIKPKHRSSSLTGLTVYDHCSTNNLEKAKQLLISLAPIDSSRQIFQTDGEGWLGLHHALWFGCSVDFCELVIRKSKHVNPWDSSMRNICSLEAVEGSSVALHFAAHGCNSVDVFKVLIREHPKALLSRATSGYGDNGGEEGMLPIQYAHKSYMQSRTNLAAIVALLRACTNAMEKNDLRTIMKLTITQQDIHLRCVVLWVFKQVRSHVDWAVAWSGHDEEEVLWRLDNRQFSSRVNPSPNDPIEEIVGVQRKLNPCLAFKYYMRNADVWEIILKYVA
jgi:hypothetical protein